MVFKTNNKGYSTGSKVVYFFLIPSPLIVSSSVSTKCKWSSLGDLVWPWHCWPLLTFRSQCKGLQKVAIVPSGILILLFICFVDLNFFLLLFIFNVEIPGILNLPFFIMLEAFLPQGKIHTRGKTSFNSRSCLAAAS